MIKTTPFSQARSELSRLFDLAVDGLQPVLIRRKGREEAVLVRREDFEELLEPFVLHPQVILEDDGSVTMVLDELDWAVNAPSRADAMQQLVNDLRNYAEDHLARADLFLRAPNRRGHFPTSCVSRWRATRATCVACSCSRCRPPSGT